MELVTAGTLFRGLPGAPGELVLDPGAGRNGQGHRPGAIAGPLQPALGRIGSPPEQVAGDVQLGAGRRGHREARHHQSQADLARPPTRCTAPSPRPPSSSCPSCRRATPRAPRHLLTGESYAKAYAEAGRRYGSEGHRGRSGERRHRWGRGTGRGAGHDQHGHRRRRGHLDPVPGAGRGRGGAPAHHGQHRRGGSRRPRDPSPPRRRRLPRTPDRRLPLQRPPAARTRPRVRRRAGQVPHQPRQRRLRGAARRQLRDHLRHRPRPRQGGAHRRQRWLPGPRPGRPRDARQRRAGAGPERRRGAGRLHDRVGPRLHRGGAAAQGCPSRRSSSPASCRRPVLLVEVYRELARRTRQPLHLGLTEAGMGRKGLVWSAASMGAAAGRGHRRHHPRLPHAAARG